MQETPKAISKRMKRSLELIPLCHLAQDALIVHDQCIDRPRSSCFDMVRDLSCTNACVLSQTLVLDLNEFVINNEAFIRARRDRSWQRRLGCQTPSVGRAARDVGLDLTSSSSSRCLSAVALAGSEAPLP